MNKLIIVCAGMIVAGCATTDQLAEANARVQELEKRVAKIEGDLYKVEEKSAPKQVAEPKFVPAKEVEQNVIDARIHQSANVFNAKVAKVLDAKSTKTLRALCVLLRAFPRRIRANPL